MASTDAPAGRLLAAASGGRLPGWARMSDARKGHAGRVSGLMDLYAHALGLGERERARWRAAAWLHDALRDADPEELRPWVPAEFRAAPGPLLHGPAVAARLEREGVDDEAFLLALRYHTVGHAALDRLGRFLYVADFLEPGRTFANEWRAELRAALPDGVERVLRDVAAARIRHLIAEGRPVRPETLGLWNSLAERP